MTAIDQLLYAFERGDLERMEVLISDDFNLRIEHYNDDQADVSWQYATNREEFYKVLNRLSKDVFSKGTQILSLDTTTLENGWTFSHLKQKFFHALRSREVFGATWILAHEKDGKLDYFREIATPLIDIF